MRLSAFSNKFLEERCFLLYSAYDGADDKEKIIAALKQHIDRFSQQLDSTMHKESAKNDVEA